MQTEMLCSHFNYHGMHITKKLINLLPLGIEQFLQNTSRGSLQFPIPCTVPARIYVIELNLLMHGQDFEQPTWT